MESGCNRIYLFEIQICWYIDHIAYVKPRHKRELNEKLGTGQMSD